MITRDPVEEIKNKLDIKDVVSDYIKLDKSGINLKARCPFHQEKTPSFFVSPQRQLWRCFGCGEGGDIFTFVEKIEGVEFRDALQRLAQKAGVELIRQNPKERTEKNKSKEICGLVSKYFNHQLESKNGKIIGDYLKSRGINKNSIEEFVLGYAPIGSRSLLEFLKERGFEYVDMERAGVAFKSDISGDWLTRFRSRIVFPIFNIQGEVVGFGARKLTDELANKIGRKLESDSAKYINSPQTNMYNKSGILYGLDKAKIDIRQKDECIVVEGYTDVILAHQAGYKNVVASSGTSLTEQQLNLIGRFTKNLVTSFDMDIAGDSATHRGINLAQSLGFNIKVISLSQGKDPADIIVENKNEWENAIQNTKSIMQFYLDSTFEKFDTKSAEGKREIGKTLAPLIASIQSKIEQAHWIQETANKLGVGHDSVWEEVKKFHNLEYIIHNKEQEDKPKKVKKFPKKEMLAQHILLSVLKNSKLLKKLEHITKDADETTKSLVLLKKIQGIEKFDYDNFRRQLDNEDKIFIDQLFMEADIMGGSWTKEYFEVILTNYKEIILKEELKVLEEKIKSEEGRGN